MPARLSAGIRRKWPAPLPCGTTCSGFCPGARLPPPVRHPRSRLHAVHGGHPGSASDRPHLRKPAKRTDGACRMLTDVRQAGRVGGARGPLRDCAPGESRERHRFAPSCPIPPSARAVPTGFRRRTAIRGSSPCRRCRRRQAPPDLARCATVKSTGSPRRTAVAGSIARARQAVEPGRRASRRARIDGEPAPAVRRNRPGRGRTRRTNAGAKTTAGRRTTVNARSRRDLPPTLRDRHLGRVGATLERATGSRATDRCSTLLRRPENATGKTRRNSPRAGGPEPRRTGRRRGPGLRPPSGPLRRPGALPGVGRSRRLGGGPRRTGRFGRVDGYRRPACGPPADGDRGQIRSSWRVSTLWRRLSSAFERPDDASTTSWSPICTGRWQSQQSGPVRLPAVTGRDRRLACALAAGPGAVERAPASRRARIRGACPRSGTGDGRTPGRRRRNEGERRERRTQLAREAARPGPVGAQ